MIMSLNRRISLEASAAGDYRSYAMQPSTYPLPMVQVHQFDTMPEAFSLDGRLWSILHNGVRTVYLVNPDNFEVLDELQIRTTWYETDEPDNAKEYKWWARGENWLLFTNEVVYHNTTEIFSRRLMYEFPLNEYRFRNTEGDPLNGSIGANNQHVMKYDWLPMHLNPFPHRANSFVPPGFLRFQRAEGDYLLLGSLLVALTNEEPLPSFIGPNAFQVINTMHIAKNPYDPLTASYGRVGRPAALLDEMQLQTIDGKLYGSAYRWCGRAYLFQHDFLPDGVCHGIMYLYISNSSGINNGAFSTSVGTEQGLCAICDGPFAIKLSQGETTQDGPWRRSEESIELEGSGLRVLELIEGVDGGDGTSTEKNYGDGYALAARFADGCIISPNEFFKINTVKEDYIPDGEEEIVRAGTLFLTNWLKAQNAVKFWLAPTGGAGGIISDEVVTETRDSVLFTDIGSGANLARYVANIKNGGACLPRLVIGDEVNWSVQELYCLTDEGTVYRTRVVKELPAESLGNLPTNYPVWNDIIRTPVKLKVLRKDINEWWDASSTAPLLYAHTNVGNPGYNTWPANVWGTYFSIPVIWMGADGLTLIDDSIPVTLADGQYARFPVVDNNLKKVYLQILDSDYNVISQNEVEIPSACDGLWRRNEVDWQGEVSDTVGIHCNMKWTVNYSEVLNAPYSILLKDSAGVTSLAPGAGRDGHCGFYHVTASTFFMLYDPMFTDIVSDLEISDPTADNPSPGYYIPNGLSGAWMREWGANPYTDAFSKVRYRNCMCVITNWSGKKADPSGYKYWTNDRLMIVSMILDTESLDLAAEAHRCFVNIS